MEDLMILAYFIGGGHRGQSVRLVNVFSLVAIQKWWTTWTFSRIQQKQAIVVDCLSGLCSWLWLLTEYDVAQPKLLIILIISQAQTLGHIFNLANIKNYLMKKKSHYKLKNATNSLI